jgi:hypothetical protein
MDILTTYTYDLAVQVIRASLLISTIHKSPQHPLNVFQPAVSSSAVPWQQFLTVEIFHLPVLMPLPAGHCLATELNAPAAQVITSRHRPHRKHPVSKVTLSLSAYSLQREHVYRAVAQKLSLSTESPLSNGSIRHIASSLELFVSNGLQVYRHFFSSKAFACDVCDQSHLPPFGTIITVFTLQLLPLLSP